MIKKILRGGDKLDGAFEVRLEIFVKEQGFSEELEFDGLDAVASHVVFYDDGKPVATGRAFQSADKPSEYILGRIAVMKPYRGTGLGRELMDALEDAARQRGAATVMLGAQCRARGFYEKCGYEAVGEIYLDEHCPHIHMRKAL